MERQDTKYWYGIFKSIYIRCTKEMGITWYSIYGKYYSTTIEYIFSSTNTSIININNFIREYNNNESYYKSTQSNVSVPMPQPLTVGYLVLRIQVSDVDQESVPGFLTLIMILVVDVLYITYLIYHHYDKNLMLIINVYYQQIFSLTLLIQYDLIHLVHIIHLLYQSNMIKFLY